MDYFVNKGAKLKCPWGSEQSELEVVHIGNPVILCGKLMANIADNKPAVNIKPFGQCSSMANPAVAAATAANYGRLQKMPCVPITPFPWLNGKMLKSYPLYVLSEITAECSGVKSSIHPRRPKWEDVYGGYPKITRDGSETDMYTDDVFKYILGSNYDKKVFNNGGAARVSVSLIEAGMDLKKDFLVQDGSEFKKKLARKNGDNEKKRIGFIASAKNLQEWLSSVWGKADVEIKGKTTIEAVQSAINGRNGVYIILGGFDSGASGATTLWLGSSNDALGGLNYVYKGGTVYFWELKGEEILEDEAGWCYGESETSFDILV